MASNKKFSIDKDLLVLTSFLIRGGNGQSQYGAGLHFLSEVADQLPASEWQKHLVHLAFDNIPYWARELLCKFYAGQASLTKEAEIFLGSRGFIDHENKIPKEVQKYCSFHMKYIWDVSITT